MKNSGSPVRLGSIMLVALIAAACGTSESDGGQRTTVTVFAAASLTDSFTELGQRFEDQNPGVDVEFSFAGSSSLATQITEGAPADVFAAADTATMNQVRDDGVASDPKIFATNTLQIATAPGNPQAISGLADLADPKLNLVICAPRVPCGAATKKVADAANLTLQPDSEEQSVTDVLNKVSSGEADAGLVYVTDVKSAEGKVEGIDFDQASGAVNAYPIAALDDADDSGMAARFTEFVLSAEAQEVLNDAGFGPATTPK